MSLIKSSLLSISSRLPSIFHCESCLGNKSQRLPFGDSTLSSNGPLDLLYTDVWGPSAISSVDGSYYYVIFVDHYTKYIWFYHMRLKSDVFAIFRRYKLLVEKYFKRPITTIYSYGGGEYTALKTFLSNEGIQHFKTPPHTPQHNGMAERRHKHIISTGLILLHQAKCHSTIGLMPSKPQFTSLFSQKPNYNKLKVFGCLCFPWLKPYTSHKLEATSSPCSFIGYSLHQSAYLCLDITTNKIYTSRHVQFIETEFPFTKLDSSISPMLFPSASTDWPSLVAPILPTQPAVAALRAPPLIAVMPSLSMGSGISSSITLPRHSTSSMESPDSPPPAPNPSALAAQPPAHPMVTRSKNNIFKPKRLYQASTKHHLPESLEPTCDSQALQQVELRQAMSDELTALLPNGTWELVPSSPSQNIVG